MGDYSWIGPVAAEIGKGINSYGASESANAQIQAAYDEMMRNLQQRFGDYDALGKAGYQDLTAQQVGPSALASIPRDEAARQAQQEALASLAELADRGGLNLADMKALNDIQGNLNRNASSRRQGLANQFAARGQLGAGAQLAMGLDAQQNDAMNANAAGESAAAQAQQRAMQAILQKGSMARGMSADDYARSRDAAMARDAIEARNAAARTDASKYNNSIRGQGFEDELAKAKGKTSLTNSMNQAVFGKGRQGAATTAAQAGYRNDLIDTGRSAWDSMGKKDSGSDTTLDYGDGNADEDASLNQNDDG